MSFSQHEEDLHVPFESDLSEYNIYLEFFLHMSLCTFFLGLEESDGTH